LQPEDRGLQPKGGKYGDIEIDVYDRKTQCLGPAEDAGAVAQLQPESSSRGGRNLPGWHRQQGLFRTIQQ